MGALYSFATGGCEPTTWTVTFYQEWNEVSMTFPSYDAAMAFIEDTGIDPDECDVVEDDDEPIIRHPVSFG